MSTTTGEDRTKSKPSGKPDKKAGDYDEDAIQVHEGIAHVRMRPAMYVGDIHERGLHHLVYEVVDNSVDEAMAGFCTRIDVTIQADGSVTVLDDGRGIPVGIHKKLGIPALEVCLTVLGGGGKFEKGSYQVSGGLHGVGVSCVNALSEWLEAEVFREGQGYQMRFARGVTTQKLTPLGPTDRRGTKITFKPDAEIFKTTVELKFEILARRLKELAYLNKGLHITLRDERGEGKFEEYRYANGIADFVQEMAMSEERLLAKPVYFTGSVVSSESGGKVEVEIAIQYNDTYSDTVVSYANNIATVDGGTHLTGFRTAITTTLNNWFKDNEDSIKTKAKWKPGDDRPTGDDYREGLIAVVSVKVPQPQFEGQTKTKLGNSDVGGIVQTVVGEYLKAWCEQNPQDSKKIINKALLAREARLAAKKAKEVVRMSKDSLRGSGIAKLKECESNDPEECELFLVEGDSAGGTAVQARDTNTQAILPLRGKILNVWKSTHDKMLGHSEIVTIIRALETGILDEFTLEKLRYDKIIIMCDADVDGSHIRTLILTFFFRQMPELIKAGKIYAAQPPLFKVTPRGKKEEHGEYVLTNEEFEKKMLELGLRDSQLLRRKDGRTVGGKQLERLVALTAEIGRLAQEVEKKSVPFRKYLEKRRQDGLLPLARVFYPATKKSPPVYTEDDLEQLLKLAREENLKVWLHTDPLDQRAGADVEVVKFSGKQRLEATLKEMEALGFSWEELFPRELAVGEDPELHPAPYVLQGPQRGERGSREELDVTGLRLLPEKVRELGQHGVKVQRYKGLGEMDPDELKTTTMDPNTRQLLKINLEDMTAATEIFGILMGSNVEQRRDYIEVHAEGVTNLDV